MNYVNISIRRIMLFVWAALAPMQVSAEVPLAKLLVSPAGRLIFGELPTASFAAKQFLISEPFWARSVERLAATFAEDAGARSAAQGFNDRLNRVYEEFSRQYPARAKKLFLNSSYRNLMTETEQNLILSLAEKEFNVRFVEDLASSNFARSRNDFLQAQDADELYFLQELELLSEADRQFIKNGLRDLFYLAPEGKSLDHSVATRMGRDDAIVAIAQEAKRSGLSLRAAFTKIKQTGLAQRDSYLRPYWRKQFEDIRKELEELRLTPEHRLPCNASGDPETSAVTTAQKANSLLEGIERGSLSAFHPEVHDVGSRYFSASEMKLLQAVSDAYAQTIEPLYLGRNAPLRSMKFTEPFKPGARTATVDHFVQSGHFTEDPWWHSAHRSGLAEITDKTSRSFVKALYPDEELVRKVFWPVAREPWLIGKTAYRRSNPVDLDRIRIVVNQDKAGNEKSLELFFKGPDGWEPYFYERKGNAWIVQTEIQGKPVRDKCMQCHVGANGAPSPRPFFLRTVKDFMGVGYKDQRIIEKLLKF